MGARVQLCGRLVAEFEGASVEHGLPGRQGRILFGFLTLHRTRRVSRDELVDAVWGESVPQGADASLSALLSRVRDAVEPAAHLEGRSELRLVLDEPASVDVEQATVAVHRAESAVALGRWTDAAPAALAARFITARAFLSGLEAAWIDEERRHLEDVQLRALEAYGSATFALGGPELPAAQRAADELVRRAPLREAGYRLLMEAKAATGNCAEALRVYDRLAALLRDELGVRPSPETRRLYERLLQTT
jgi:DNA-binding SARP family transcriptional activator